MTDHDATMQVMERIFAPRSVAVIGVPRGMKTGRLFLEALLKPAFKGPIYPVNPNADEILGLKTYPSVSAIGEPIDLAIVATPPAAATSVIADCGQAGVAAAVLFTAGFGELGTPDGEARAEAADSLRYFAADDARPVVGMYVEGARNGRKFFEALRYAATRKPVVLWKSGRTEGGARAARSHTGALAGANAIWEAAARQSGAIPAKTLLDVADLAVALRMRPGRHAHGRRDGTGRPQHLRRRRSGRGGPATDGVRCADHRPASQRDRGRRHLAAQPRRRGADHVRADRRLRACDRDRGIGPDVDGVVVIGGRGSGEGAQQFAQLMCDAQQSIARPVAMIASEQGADVGLLRRYSEAGIGLFPTAERAVHAFAGVARYAQFRRDSGDASGW